MALFIMKQVDIIPYKPNDSLGVFDRTFFFDPAVYSTKIVFGISVAVIINPNQLIISQLKNSTL